MTRLDLLEWRYLPRGRVTHALRRADDNEALCGVYVVDSAEWYGTGSQAEYEHVAALPRCTRCVRKAGAP